jgi:hypothetical protein
MEFDSILNISLKNSPPVQEGRILELFRKVYNKSQKKVQKCSPKSSRQTIDSEAQTSSDSVGIVLKTPLLDRRGAETDERSESDEAGWWITTFKNYSI